MYLAGEEIEHSKIHKYRHCKNKDRYTISECQE